jgi:hypothetical protein
MKAEWGVQTEGGKQASLTLGKCPSRGDAVTVNSCLVIRMWN